VRSSRAAVSASIVVAGRPVAVGQQHMHPVDCLGSGLHHIVTVLGQGA
jgi:hypothetical protein